MHLTRIAFLVLTALALGACAETTDLVIIPPEVERAAIPEAMTKNAHAVYFYDVGQVHFDPIDIDFERGRFYAFTRRVKVKLLTRAATEGDMFGNIFLRHQGDLVSIQAHVEKPDGTRVDLQPSDFLKTVLVKDAVPDSNTPIDIIETTILFPGLQPGDVISYQYTQRGSPSTWQFNHVSAPVMYSRFMMARPPFRVEIQPVIVNRHNLEIEQTEESGMATGLSGRVGVSQQAVFDVWTARNVPAITFEEGMPAEIDLSSYVGVWWFSRRYDWATLGDVYHKWFGHYGRPTGRVKEETDKVIQGIADSRARAKAIHDWVKTTLNITDYAGLTSVPREMEIDPVDIAKLLKEKNATPEEAANLTYLMLQAAGVDASLVLTSDEESAPVLEEIPSAGQFTYVLLALPDGTWVDTTHRACPFGALPWGFEGRKALWVKAGTAAFKDIPVTAPEANKRTVAVRGELGTEGQAKVSAKVNLTGQMAFAFRRLLVPMKPQEREDTVRDMVTATADAAEVDGFELQGLDEFDKPVDITINYHVPRYAEVLRDKMMAKLGAFVHLVGCPVLSRNSGVELYVCPKAVVENRANPLRFPFKRLDELDIQVALPLGFSLQALPKGFRTRELDKGTAVGMQTSYGLSEDGKTLIVPRKLSVNETFIDLQSYANLQAMLGRFQAQKDTLVTLELPKMD